jgi:hypothetical protein
MKGRIISFEEYKQNPFKKGISNWSFKGSCEDCNKEFVTGYIKVYRKRSIDNDKSLCVECYLQRRCYSNKEWLDKNSESQKIAQNKPEQKLKNAIGVSKSWTKERRNKESERMKEVWQNASQSLKDAMLKPTQWTSVNNEKFQEILRKSSKGKSGYYKGIFYQSFLELNFLIVCKERGIPVKRYDLNPIPYKDTKGKSRLYHPDFIIFDKIVVEIKGFIFDKKHGIENVNLKKKAAEISCKKKDMRYRLFFGSSFQRKTLKLLKKIHEDCQQKNKES